MEAMLWLCQHPVCNGDIWHFLLLYWLVSGTSVIQAHRSIRETGELCHETGDNQDSVSLQRDSSQAVVAVESPGKA